MESLNGIIKCGDRTELGVGHEQVCVVMQLRRSLALPSFGVCRCRSMLPLSRELSKVIAVVIGSRMGNYSAGVNDRPTKESYSRTGEEDSQNQYTYNGSHAILSVGNPN